MYAKNITAKDKMGWRESIGKKRISQPTQKTVRSNEIMGSRENLFFRIFFSSGSLIENIVFPTKNKKNGAKDKINISING